MKYFFPLLAFLATDLPGCAQESPQRTGTQNVGGACEGCAAVHESLIPFARLNETDTLPDFEDPGPKMEVSGVIYQNDGKTPAKDVVLYIYHTNQQGIYPQKEDAKGWARRHGFIRGWVKTNEKGEYRFYTLRPAAYPGGNNPEHIHAIIKEPDKNEYYIDEFHFADDSILKKSQAKFEDRGGSGVVQPTYQADRQLVHRDIILGLHIPGYPG